jgi:hypothetical protein
MTGKSARTAPNVPNITTSNMAEPLTTGSTLAHGLVSDASAAVLSHKRYRIVLLLVRFGHLSDVGPLPAP